ncbi:uncharacterized protein LOC101888022 [Musca domestica]|uniref:Uncharacterized protein LOC101888022 n=1 Tax=Musca domestica TaxID=7370 RepID=A0A1I8N8N1_MUSDO|nr:uncharacterized protein LOC101888022 [Musca domestica]
MATAAGPSDTSVLNNTTAATPVPTNPHELALQSLCKQILKSRLFRGFYEERRYVDNVQGYRDIVSLHKSEKELNKLLKDIRDKLQMFYAQQNPDMWVGVTCGPLVGSKPTPGAMDTFIWAEIEDLAFGQYWFSIKSLRFRANEVVVKLKVVRSVDSEEMSEKYIKTSTVSTETAQADSTTTGTNTASAAVDGVAEKEVNLQDFANLFQQWYASFKQTIYDFMANDISKENLKGVIRFLGLVIVSLCSGALMAVKFLGIFAIRFMFEFSRLTHVLTPIILKIIEVFNKIVGGFYLLLAMIWKDAVVNRNQPKSAMPALEYNRPMYKSIQYDVRQRRSTGAADQQ